MTELWTFSNIDTDLVGGSNDDENSTTQGVGGVSVSQLLCKNKSANDSEKYSVFSSLAVPLGLVYFPSNETNTEPITEEDFSIFDNFDRIFYMSAKDLGKSTRSSSQNGKSKTRKKIP